MPRITIGGGASNAREGLDPDVGTSGTPSSAPPASEASEVTREEDENAPATRPGEHVQFFQGADEQRPDDSEPDEQEEGDNAGLPPAPDESGSEGPDGPVQPEQDTADLSEHRAAATTPHKAAKRSGGKG
jgi:hypothetical protein